MNKELSKERWEYLKQLKPSKGRMIHVSKQPNQKHPGSTYRKKKGKVESTPKAI